MWDFYWILCFQKGSVGFCFQKGCSVGFCVFRRDVGFCVFRRDVLWDFVFSEGMFCSIFEPPHLQPQHVEDPLSPPGVLQLQRWGQCVSYSIIACSLLGALLKLCMI